MNDTLLQALMRLFALVAHVNEHGFARNERDVVVEYLQRQFSDELADKYLRYFDKFLHEYHPEQTLEGDDVVGYRELDYDVIIKSLCSSLQKELEQSQKILILVYLLDFINRGEEPAEKEYKFIQSVVVNLNLPEKESIDIVTFTFDQYKKVKSPANLLFINGKKTPEYPRIKHLFIDKMEGRIGVFHIKSTNTYIFRYQGTQVLLLNGHHVKNNRSYVWSPGSVIKNPIFGSIYYIWVAGRFIQETSKSNFVFTAEDIEFSYGNSQNGIRRFSLNEESGRLIGIIGGSGSGKSTLLKVLSGVIKPKRGKICINGYNIHEYEEELRGIIGFVPQDDFLIKELTTYENLYYNARLSFSNYPEEKIVELVEEALQSFDLVEARDLRVGDALNTFLSGGQRKRLNIALELIREPSVLFVDEPNSGLSSMDSEKVINLLKRQTFKGKLVFANIHQPSSDIFKLFDKLLVVDQGGRVIYYGNPIDAIAYFKRISHSVDVDESECLTCGNINADQILRSVESRVVDVNGRLTRKRKILPNDWYQYYMERIDPVIKQIRRPFTNDIPRSLYKIPSRWEQVKIFFQRDIFSKLKNSQYMAITLVEAPVLALLLSFYTRSARDVSGDFTRYIFSRNANIPAYLFMSVIVSLFLGLVISAEEIFRDRKILERERFLSLSRSSYLLSKVSIVFMISAIQMFLFVIIGNNILEVKNMSWRFFLVLFSTSCWANMIGLNVSAGLKSVVAIYILVPLILVPQLLFSGVVVSFHNLNKAIYSDKYVPFIGETMTSRWSYEALMVTQFKDNRYEKIVFPYEQAMDEAMYFKAYQIPQVRKILDEVKEKPESVSGQNKYKMNLVLLHNEIRKLSQNLDIRISKSTKNYIRHDGMNDSIYQYLGTFLEKARGIYHKRYMDAFNRKNKYLESLENKENGKEVMIDMKNKYHNFQVESIVTNENEMTELLVFENEIVRLRNPVYTLPHSQYGRAQFYAPYKQVAGYYIDTFWFNIIIIWLTTGVWFIILYYDLLRKLITYFENIKLQRFNRRILLFLKQYERQ